MKPVPLLSALWACTSFAFAATEPNPAVQDRMKELIAANEIAGAVTLVADPQGLLSLDATGFADIGERAPMKPDSLFWIASMTKPITATAVMMMQEEGKLSVDDPVARYLPEFKDLKDADGKEVTVTIRQCLTHSSGLAELSPAEGARISTLAELVKRVVAKPVKFAPGSKWEYCQTGINTVARVVEVVSGAPFPDFLQQRIFDPLGMKDTGFYPSETLVKRLASSYRRAGDGTLDKTPITFLAGKDLWDHSRYPLANGGLFSTAEDYAKFARMILRGGELDGHRYLKEESVKQMTTVQSGDLKTGFTPGNGWGLGWCVVREPQGITATLSPGTFGHGGAYGTQAWIDPVKQRVYLLLIQRADFENSDASLVRRAFHEALAKP